MADVEILKMALFIPGHELLNITEIVAAGRWTQILMVGEQSVIEGYLQDTPEMGHVSCFPTSYALIEHTKLGFDDTPSSNRPHRCVGFQYLDLRRKMVLAHISCKLQSQAKPQRNLREPQGYYCDLKAILYNDLRVCTKYEPELGR